MGRWSSDGSKYIDQAVEIPEGITLSGSNMELYGKSTDAKPTANIKIGTTFLEIDTKVVFIFDGAGWVVF